MRGLILTNTPEYYAKILEVPKAKGTPWLWESDTLHIVSTSDPQEIIDFICAIPYRNILVDNPQLPEDLKSYVLSRLRG